MAANPRSIAFKSLYVVRFSLELSGVLSLLFALFTLVVAPSLFRGARGGMHALAHAITGSVVLMAIGLGLILPRIWTKLLASTLLTVAGIWFLINDAQRFSYLDLYNLLLIPLPLTLWLKAGYRKFKIERLPNANQV